jgi:hypothetical protein
MDRDGPRRAARRSRPDVDDAVREYFSSIEARFIEKRGQALLLSPGDVARVAEWHRQGIPLQAVLEAIDVHFERMARRGRTPRRAVTLAYLDDEVVDAWAGVRRRKVGRAPAPRGGEAALPGAPQVLATREEHAKLCGSLRGAAERLAGSAATEPLAAHVRTALGKLEAKIALFDEASPEHDDERAEDHLRRLERSLLDHAMDALGEPERERRTREAIQALGDKRQRMDPKAGERAVAQLVDRSVRETLGVPRLSLFYA